MICIYKYYLPYYYLFPISVSLCFSPTIYVCLLGLLLFILLEDMFHLGRAGPLPPPTAAMSVCRMLEGYSL